MAGPRGTVAAGLGARPHRLLAGPLLAVVRLSPAPAGGERSAQMVGSLVHHWRARDRLPVGRGGVGRAAHRRHRLSRLPGDGAGRHGRRLGGGRRALSPCVLCLPAADGHAALPCPPRPRRRPARRDGRDGAAVPRHRGDHRAQPQPLAGDQHPAHVREDAARGRAGQGARRGRGRRTHQIRLPREYEPRDPHADARHHRHDQSAAADPARRAPARARRARPRAHRRPDDHHQRHPRCLEARGRSPRVRGHRPRDRRGRAPSAGAHGAEGGAEEPGLARRHRRGGAPDPARRPDPDPADPAEPGEQRDQVHRAGQHRHQGPLRGGPPARGGAARRGRGHRHRHPRRRGRQPFRQIHAGRPEHRPPLRRHRSRPRRRRRLRRARRSRAAASASCSPRTCSSTRSSPSRC